MSAIDDFIGRRWKDAKAELLVLDQGYVAKVETELRLYELDLLPAWHPFHVEYNPARRLSKSWHRLLEACFELIMQVEHVRTAAVGLTADANRHLTQTEAGKRANFYFRSWFIHVYTLGERTLSIIERTVQVYSPSSKSSSELTSRYQRRVTREIIRPNSHVRHEFAHGRTDQSRSWASGITEDELWEGMVAIGMTPQMQLVEFGYPSQGSAVLSGKYEQFIDATEGILNIIGSILEELEAEVVIVV